MVDSIMGGITMSEIDSFISVWDLVTDDRSTSKLATAIETVGFYTWDRFGRYIHISFETKEDAHIAIRNELLNELAGGYKGNEEDQEYFYHL